MVTKAALTALSLALVLAACSRDPAPVAEPTNEAEGVSASAAASPAPSEPASEAAAAGPSSQYTSLKGCRVVERIEEGEYLHSTCDAPGAAVLEFVSFDGRDDLRVGRRGAEPANLELPSLGNGAFNAIGPAIEWRGQAGPDGFTPQALIVRNRIFDTPERPDKARSTLVVVDLGRRCVIAEVPPGPGQNEAARQAAAGKGPCVKLR